MVLSLVFSQKSMLVKMKGVNDKNCFHIALFELRYGKGKLSVGVLSKNIPEKVLSPLQNNTGDTYNVVHNTTNSNYWPLQALLQLTVINKST